MDKILMDVKLHGSWTFIFCAKLGLPVMQLFSVYAVTSLLGALTQNFSAFVLPVIVAHTIFIQIEAHALIDAHSLFITKSLAPKTR